MKKWNNKGFMLAETLVVSAVVLTSLVIVYIQFRSIQKSYSTSFTYNSVEDLYRVANIRDFITQDSIVFERLITDVNGANYLDISSCPTGYFSNPEYCMGLFKKLKAKTVLLTKEDITPLKAIFREQGIYEQGLTDFIVYLSPAGEARYRLVVAFDGGTYATVKVDH